MTAQQIASSSLDDIRTMMRGRGWLDVDVDSLSAEDDLYRAGLTSHASVALMLALEEHYAVEFPERLLNRKTFRSLSAIGRAVAELTAGR